MTLKEVRTGETVRVTQIGGEGALRQHFLDMGIIPGTEITLSKLAPMGDPMELTLHGYELTLRLADAELIEVEPVSEKRSAELKKAAKKPNCSIPNSAYCSNYKIFYYPIAKFYFIIT